MSLSVAQGTGKRCVLCILSVKTHAAETCVLEKPKRVIKCL